MTAGVSLQSRVGWVGWAVAVILLLDLLLFLPSFGNFFCGDSLYYLSRRADEVADTVRLFTTLDNLKSYRPLNHLVFDYLMYPLSKLDPRGYQVMTRALHLSAALLVFFLLKRLTRSPGAAVLGLFFFAAHGENFYLNYDPSFLPDLLVGLCGTAALLAYVQGHRLASTAFFGLALLSKESALTILVGLAVVGLLVDREKREPLPGAMRRQLLALAPHIVLAGCYLVLQLFLRRGVFFPTEPGPYSLSWSWWTLWLKGKYLAWLFNMPADWERRRWWLFPPLLLMLPALIWILGSLRNAWRRDARPLLLCAAWALASVAPVLLISQVPMKHNLQFSVLALATALAVSLDGRLVHGRLLPLSAWWLIVPMALATAFHVRNDMRYSWVAEGSDIAERSLAEVRATHPALPKGALLYLLPAVTRGNISWYFDGGALFRLFYDDPKLEMRFANLKHPLPPDAAARHDVFFFRFRDGDRLFDTTPEYRQAIRDMDSDRFPRFDLAHALEVLEWGQTVLPRERDSPLLLQIDRPYVAWLKEFRVESAIPWQPRDLLDGTVARAYTVERPSGKQLALVMLPGSTIRFPTTSIPANARLRFALTLARPMSGWSKARISLVTGQGTRTVFENMLDNSVESERWQDHEVDLSALAGDEAVLVFENASDRSAPHLKWISLRLDSSHEPLPQEPAKWRLLFQTESAQISFDRREVYPDYQRFDTPNGRPAFLQWTSLARPYRPNLVTVAGARACLPVSALPEGAILQVSATHGATLGDGALGRIYWEQNGRRELLFERMVYPRQTYWYDQDISLARWAGQAGVLCFEASSGPKRNTIGDWLAWGRMRIVW